MLIEILIGMLLSLTLLGSLLKPLNSTFLASRIFSSEPSQQVPECEAVAQRDSWIIEKCISDSKIEFLKIASKEPSGFSMLELTAVLFLSLCLFTVLAKTFGAATLQARLSEKQAGLNSAALRISSEARRMSALSNQHPFTIAPIIHKNGQIRLRNGSENKVMSGNPGLRPDRISDALSNIDLAGTELLDMQSCTQSAYLYQGSACLRFKDSADLSKYKSFALYSVDGFVEAQGKLSGNGKCKSFELQAGPSMFFENPGIQEKCNLMLILPINAIQTIYQSTSADLRLLTHRLDENAENQPLSKALPGLSLKLNISQDYLSLLIEAHKKTVLKKRIQLLFKKSSGLNFLLNSL